MAKPQSITSLPPSPDDDRRRRMRNYTLTMIVRVACIPLIFVVPGWWALVPAIGAIVLPYFAVILANVTTSSGGTVEAPEPRSVVLLRPPVNDDDGEA